MFFLQWQSPAWLCGIFAPTQFIKSPLNHSSDSAGSWVFVLFKYGKKICNKQTLSLYVYFFFKFSFCLLWKLGIGIFFGFLAHSLFGSCSFDKCCVVAQPKAVGFGDFVLYIFISVAESVTLAAKLNVKFLMSTVCYRFIYFS